MGTERNYLINTTTISTTASGTTIGSGNTQSGTFVVAQTLVRSGGGVSDFLGTSQTWSIHYVVSAMATPYEMRLKLQRRNSAGTMQTESGYTTVRSATGTYDDNLTWASGTFASDDQLALVWEHRRPSGSGNKSGTINANGSSYIDAPVPDTVPLTQSAADDLNNWSDGLVLGVGAAFTDNLNAWQDGAQISLSLELPLSDDLNNWADALTGNKKPRWLDAQSQSLDAVGNSDLTLALSDDLNLLADGAALELGYLLDLADAFTLSDQLALTLSQLVSFSDDLNSWQDDLALGYGLLAADDLNNLADSFMLGYGLAVADDANQLTDNLNLGYGLLAEDDLNTWQEALGLGYGLLVAEDGNNLSDDLQVALADTIISLALADDLNNWQESLTLGYGLLITEDANALADDLQTTLADNVLALSIADNLNNWQDSLDLIVGDVLISLSLSDNLDLWQDGVGALMSLELGVAGDLNNWLDLLELDLLGPADITLEAGDDLNNWGDAGEISLGDAPPPFTYTPPRAVITVVSKPIAQLSVELHPTAVLTVEAKPAATIRKWQN